MFINIAVNGMGMGGYPDGLDRLVLEKNSDVLFAVFIFVLPTLSAFIVGLASVSLDFLISSNST
ncbi:uncharacterized protein METZ01_LOCUS147248, partial [marine metagenome]